MFQLLFKISVLFPSSRFFSPLHLFHFQEPQEQQPCSLATKSATTMISDIAWALLYVMLLAWACDSIRLMLRAWLHLSEQVASEILRYVLIGIFLLSLLKPLAEWLRSFSQMDDATTEVLLDSEEGEETPTALSE